MNLFPVNNPALNLICLVILLAMLSMVLGESFSFCDTSLGKMERLRRFREKICSSSTHGKKSSKRKRCKARSSRRSGKNKRWFKRSAMIHSLWQMVPDQQRSLFCLIPVSTKELTSFRPSLPNLLFSAASARDIHKETFWRDLQTCCNQRDRCTNIFHVWELNSCDPIFHLKDKDWVPLKWRV